MDKRTIAYLAFRGDGFGLEDSTLELEFVIG